MCLRRGDNMTQINLGLNSISNPYKRTQSNSSLNTQNEKVFNNNKPKQVYMMTDDMLYSGGNGTGLSFYIKYADGSTEDNPVVVAKGVDENGKEFEQKIAINDINPSSASIVEMRALEAHFNVDKGGGLSSLPKGIGNMGLNDRRNFLSMFEDAVQDLQKLARYDLSQFYKRNLATYENIAKRFKK